MKIIFAIVMLLIASSLTAQSLKDSLFSGKLKNPLKQSEAAKDSARKAAKDSVEVTTKQDAGTPVTTENKTAVDAPNTPSVNNPVTANTPATEAQGQAEILPDSLNRLYVAKQKAWKRFIDQQTLIIATQADESRKVKRGEYYIEFDYEIGLNGRVKTSNVTCSPQNEFLLQAITDALTRTPILAPPLYSDGKPRTVSAKQQMTILKKK